MTSRNNQNIFINSEVASEYDSYYQTEPGKTIDKIEKEIVLVHLKDLPERKWLELGCGTGHWTQFFIDCGFKVTAVDNSEAMLKIAHSKQLKNVQFLQADAARLPFPDVSFSGIVAITMLEFVNDLNGVFNEIDRVLEPGGTLVLGCLNANSELGKNKNNDPVFKHAHFFKPEEIKEMLDRFGNPRISAGVYFSPEFDLLDGTVKQSTGEPAFIAASVKKIKIRNHGNNS